MKRKNQDDHWLLRTMEVRPMLDINTADLQKFNPHLLVVQTPGAPLHVRNYIAGLLDFLDKRPITTALARWFANSPEALIIGNRAREFYALTAAKMARNHLLTTQDLMRLFGIRKETLSSWSQHGLEGEMTKRSDRQKTYKLEDVMRACVICGPGSD